MKNAARWEDWARLLFVDEAVKSYRMDNDAEECEARVAVDRWISDNPLPPGELKYRRTNQAIHGLLLDQARRGTGCLASAVRPAGSIERSDPFDRPEIRFWRQRFSPPGPSPEDTSPPELAVVMVAIGDLKSGVRTKLTTLFTDGARLVWIIDVEFRSVMVYQTPDEGRILHLNATLSGEDVLPGFSCKVSELFA